MAKIRSDKPVYALLKDWRVVLIYGLFFDEFAEVLAELEPNERLDIVIFHSESHWDVIEVSEIRKIAPDPNYLEALAQNKIKAVQLAL